MEIRADEMDGGGDDVVGDWPMLTWSFGWIGLLEPSSPPRSSIARLEITSLAFMLVEVPDPVWNTSRTKALSSLPSMTSSAASTMASFSSSSIRPSSWLTTAASSFIAPRASTKRRGLRRSLMGKLSRARRVWAPKRASRGTSTSPIESRSTRCGVSLLSHAKPPLRANTSAPYSHIITCTTVALYER